MAQNAQESSKAFCIATDGRHRAGFCTSYDGQDDGCIVGGVRG